MRNRKRTSNLREASTTGSRGRLKNEEKKSPGNYFADISKIKSKVDNKTPAFSVDAYYKPQSLEADAERIMKIDAENYKLVQNINAIYRSGGSVDCWNREFKYSSTLPEKNTEFDGIDRENKSMMKRIDEVSGLYSTADLMREWKKSRAAKESEKQAMKNSMKMRKLTKKQSPRNTIEDYAEPRCYFELEIESNHRKLGKLIFQLFIDVVPKTCENFQAYCRGFEGLSYEGTPFHRIVPGYWCQGGDVTKFNGSGETSIWGKTFEDENYELKHSERGILSTSSFERNSNTSKFNLTFSRLESMDGKAVVFGKVISGFSTLRELESFGTERGRPTVKIIVSKCGVL